MAFTTHTTEQHEYAYTADETLPAAHTRTSGNGKLWHYLSLGGSGLIALGLCLSVLAESSYHSGQGVAILFVGLALALCGKLGSTLYALTHKSDFER